MNKMYSNPFTSSNFRNEADWVWNIKWGIWNENTWISKVVSDFIWKFKNEFTSLNSYQENQVLFSTNSVEELKKQWWQEYKMPDYIVTNSPSHFLSKRWVAYDLDRKMQFKVKLVRLNFNSEEDLRTKSIIEEHKSDDFYKLINFPLKIDIYFDENIDEVKIITANECCSQCNYWNCCCGLFFYDNHTFTIKL